MLELFLNGGLMMVPILVCSITCLAVIIDRIRTFRAAETDAAALRTEVDDLLHQGKLDDAIRACERGSGPVAAVLLTGLARYRKLLRLERPLVEVEASVAKSMEEFAPQVMEGLEKRLDLLPLIASISPLLGMTGTVTGMINSFAAMSDAAGLDAGAVAAGISEALIATASGLLVAMPAVVAFNIFTKRVDRFALDIDAGVAGLVGFISTSRKLQS